MGVFGSGFAFLYSCCYCFIKWCNLFFFVDSMFVWEKWAPHLQNRCYQSAISNLIEYCYVASAAVGSSHMTVSSSASWSRFSPSSNFVNGHVSTMWKVIKLAQRGLALTCPETVHQIPCMTREIETWLSDSRVGIWFDYCSQLTEFVIILWLLWFTFTFDFCWPTHILTCNARHMKKYVLWDMHDRMCVMIPGTGYVCLMCLSVGAKFVDVALQCVDDEDIWCSEIALSKLCSVQRVRTTLNFSNTLFLFVISHCQHQTVHHPPSLF